MCFIIPRNILENIAEKGNKDQVEGANEALLMLANPRLLHLPHLPSPIFATPGKTREIYDARNKTNLPGNLIWSEGGTTPKDVAANEAYDGSGATYDFFKEMFGRDSIDDKGMTLMSTVHYGRKFANAFWDGTHMVFGDGDSDIFNRFSSVIDVIGHELAHGVTEHTAGLVYRKQPGALNEHFSDVFGSIIKQRSIGHTADKADWLIGEGLFTDEVDARGLRDMKNPGTAYDDERIGKDPQPDHMDRYVDTDFDAGGVHINSGIPNRAFALASISLGGMTQEKTGRVWYEVLSKHLKSNSQFQDCANATVKVAGQMFGAKSLEQKAILDAWRAVGLTPKV